MIYNYKFGHSGCHLGALSGSNPASGAKVASAMYIDVLYNYFTGTARLPTDVTRLHTPFLSFSI